MEEKQKSENIRTRESGASSRLAAYLDGMGNSGAKCCLVLAMNMFPRDYQFSGDELHTVLLERAGDEPVELGSEQNTKDWCEESLIPIGAVYAEADHYVLSDEAHVLGVALAGFLLPLSEKYRVSLRRPFGESHSRSDDIRAPSLRPAIIEALLNASAPPTIDELSAAAGNISKEAIITSLRALSIGGLLAYHEWDASNDVNEYRVVALPAKLRGDASEITMLLQEFFTENSTANLDEIMAWVSVRRPTTFTHDPKADRKLVSRTLKAMVRRGKLERTKYKNANTGVDVSFNKWQKSFWQDLLAGLNAFTNGNQAFINFCYAAGRAFIQDPQRVRSALLKAAAESPQADDGTEKSARAIVLSILHQHGGRLSVRQVVELAAESDYRSLSMYGARHALNELVKLEYADKVKDKINMYSIKGA